MTMLATTALLLNQMGKNVVPLYKAELFPSFEDGGTPDEVTYVFDVSKIFDTLSRFSLFHLRSTLRTQRTKNTEHEDALSFFNKKFVVHKAM